jgi:hypothetical protein
MKKKNLVLLAFALTTICITSCTSSDDVAHLATKPVASTFKNPYSFIGVLHNEALDSVKAQKVTIDNLKHFTKEFTDRHNKQIPELAKSQQEDQHSEVSIDNGFDIGKKTCQVTTRAAMDALTDSLIKAFPIEGQKYIAKIYEICDKEEHDSVKINNIFDNFDITINNDTNIDDTLKHVLLATSSIARATNIYNADTFRTLSTRGATWRSSCRADVGGAIGGILGRGAFVRAAFSGLMFGPSGIVCSFARDAVRGAIASSALHVISGGRI